ncbi:MAG: hypothetical protein RIM84_18295 [Alphaproteobacteria bacterium]
MFHHRTARKTIDRLIEVLEEMATRRQFGPPGGAPDAAQALSLAEKLRSGFARKKYDIDEAEARLLVAYLDAYNLTAPSGTEWDKGVDKLAQDLQKAFAKSFSGTVYPHDKPAGAAGE